MGLMDFGQGANAFTQNFMRSMQAARQNRISDEERERQKEEEKRQKEEDKQRNDLYKKQQERIEWEFLQKKNEAERKKLEDQATRNLYNEPYLASYLEDPSLQQYANLPGEQQKVQQLRQNLPLSLMEKSFQNLGNQGRVESQYGQNEFIPKQQNQTPLSPGGKAYYDINKGQMPKSAEDIKRALQATRLDPQPTFEERERERKAKYIGELNSKSANERYAEGWKLNDDGSLYIEGYTGAPEKLPSFDKVMGKRGTVNAARIMGETWDDAKELKELLQEPSVKKDLKNFYIEAKQGGFLGKLGGKAANSVQLWLQKRGLSGDTPTATAIVRMQRLASDERKRYLGAAVTNTELESTLAWMPSAGDSYDTMVNKINLMEQEGKQQVQRIFDIYRDTANMTPWYKAFGMEPFGGKAKTTRRKFNPSTGRLE